MIIQASILPQILWFAHRSDNLSVNEYDMIRPELGENILAIQLRNSLPWLPRFWDGRRIRFKKMGNAQWPSYSGSGQLTDDVEKMKKPVKLHSAGCVHSEMPEVIIQAEEASEHGLESRLISGLYFRRCDGVFKNIRGETLE